MTGATALAAAWAALLGVGLLEARPRQTRSFAPTGLKDLRSQQPAPTRVAGQPPGGVTVGRAALVGVGALALGLTAAAIVATALLIRPVLVKRRRRLKKEWQVRRELPEVAELLRMALLAGGSVEHAIQDTAAVCGGCFGAALGQVVVRVARGHRLGAALGDLVVDTSDDAKPLVRALLAADRHGVSIEQTLQRVGAEARESRRRHAQKRAQQVPVKLLIPLVVCVLPAFALLTLVPTLVGTFQGLDLSPA